MLVEDMAPDRIREIRTRENASRAVFSRYLNGTKGLHMLVMTAAKLARGSPATESAIGNRNRSVVPWWRSGHWDKLAMVQQNIISSLVHQT